ncbi:recombinase family protein [Prevotella sp. MA2016]|uniref:recombinase family protein n=1 Tax=Prevotella sp. MA2016 TaxID=1408310 RepID=UPI00048BB821|nr:recombinase family protein [Prevotella sp. MA2016]
MAKKQRAALLARVSTPQQIKLGLESQVAVLKKQAIEDGYEVPNELIFQEQISGLDANKPIRKSLQDLMDAVEAHKVDVCYIFEWTRISRNPYNLIDRVRWFNDHKIPIFIKDIDSWTLDRVTKEEITKTKDYLFGAATYGEKEAEKMRIRTMRGRNEAAQKGLYVGHLSDGYYVVETEKGKEIKVDNSRRGVIERIFNLYEHGYSTDKIAEILNLEGVPTASKYRLHSPLFKGYQETYRKKSTDVPISRDKTKWQGAVIAAYLNNRWYIGERQYNKQSYSIDPIVKKEQWGLVSSMLEDNKANFRSKRESSKHTYLLSRLIYCGKCGKKMYGHYTGLNNHYYCSSYDEGGKCGLRGVNKENIEAIVALATKARGILDLYDGSQSAVGDFFDLNPKVEKKLREEIRINNLHIVEIEKELEKNAIDYKTAIRESISSADNKERKSVYDQIIEELEEEKIKHIKLKEELTQKNILNNKRLNAKSNIGAVIKKVVEEKNLITLRELFLAVIDNIYVYNLTPSIDVIRIRFSDGVTRDWIYAYRLLKQSTISLHDAFNVYDLIYYDEEKNILKCKRGKAVIYHGANYFPYEDFMKKQPSVIEQMGKGGVDYFVISDEIVSAKEFVKYCANQPSVAHSFERLEGLSSEAIEQNTKYKKWRKKYNTGLPTCVPYVVKDTTYEEVSKRRKYLYNRKNKIKKHKKLTDDEKKQKMDEIDKELALLSAKVKYMNRDEALREYEKQQKNK